MDQRRGRPSPPTGNGEIEMGIDPTTTSVMRGAPATTTVDESEKSRGGFRVGRWHHRDGGPVWRGLHDSTPPWRPPARRKRRPAPTLATSGHDLPWRVKEIFQGRGMMIRSERQGGSTTVQRIVRLKFCIRQVVSERLNPGAGREGRVLAAAVIGGECGQAEGVAWDMVEHTAVPCIATRSARARGNSR
jgi:hypothetical protein